MKKTFLFVILITAWFSGLTQFSNQSNLYTIFATTAGSNYGCGLSMVDFNQDGADDLSICLPDSTPRFFTYNGSDFDEVFLLPEEHSDHGKQISWIDYDNDGELDLYVSSEVGINRLYHNDGNLALSDVTISAGIEQNELWESQGFSWGDYDNDGYLDLYQCNFENSIYTNKLYHNNGNGTFTDVTTTSGTGNGPQNTFQSVWIDINEDGWQDLFVMNDRDIYTNAFYINNGDGTFTDMAFEMGTDQTISAMSASFGDYDNDQDFDLYLTNTPSGNVFLRNDNGIFIDQTNDFAMEVNSVSWGAAWIDFDNDRDEDLHVSTAPFDFSNFENQFFYNNGNGTFTNDNTVVGENQFASWATAYGDYNNDGFLDLVDHNIQPYVTFWEGVPNGNHWSKIKLEGTSSNKNALGSKIELYSGDHPQMRYVNCGENYHAQNSFYEFFGLGSTCGVDSVCVTWPSGTKEWFYDVPCDQSVVLLENSTASISLVYDEFSFCEGDSILISVEGLEGSTIWNNDLEGSEIWVSEAGSYSASVTSEFGIIAYSDTLEVEVFPTPILGTETSDPDCYGSMNGSIEIMNLIGTGISTVDWFDENLEGSFIEDLDEGSYTFEVVDDNGCSSFGAAFLNNPDSLSYTIIGLQDQNCVDDCDGFIELTIAGGTGDLELNYGVEDNTEICSGDYEFIVTDENGCTVSEQYSIQLLSELEASIDVINADGTTLGIGEVTATNGVEPYTYDWSDSNTGPINDQLDQGSHSVTVTDSVGCSQTLNFFIVNVGIEEIPVIFEILISNDIVTINVQNAIFTSDVELYDLSGRILTRTNLTNQNFCNVNLHNFEHGVYILKFELDNQIFTSKVYYNK